MRWLSYGILCYLALGIQLGVSAFIGPGGTAPNLPLLAAVFMASIAPRQGALLGCFLLGLAQDACSQHAIGIYALSYALLAVVVTSAVHLMRREHLLTHVLLTLLGGTIIMIIFWLNFHLAPSGQEMVESSSAMVAPLLPAVSSGSFRSVAYTTLLAPVVLGILVRLAFLFDAPRRNQRD